MAAPIPCAAAKDLNETPDRCERRKEYFFLLLLFIWNQCLQDLQQYLIAPRRIPLRTVWELLQVGQEYFFSYDYSIIHRVKTFMEFVRICWIDYIR